MLKSQIDPRVLRDRAGGVVFARGQQYVTDGRVHLRRHDGTSVDADVVGSETYEVEIEAVGRGISAGCTCPFAEDGHFCKHMVATVLCWLEAEPGDRPLGSETPGHDAPPELDGDVDPTGQQDGQAQLRSFLAAQPTERLVELLLEAGRRDPMFAARLAVEAGGEGRPGGARGSALDELPLRRALVDAVSIEDFIDYGEAWDYFWGIGEVLDAVDDLTDAGFAPSAARLALFAMELLDEFGGGVDDSGGGLVEAIARIEEIHLRASRHDDVDVEALAETLLHHAVTSDYDVFYDAPAQYAGILGESGLRHYRSLVEQRWREVPDGLGPYDGDRFALTHLREQAAEALGGANLLLEVLRETENGPYDTLRIAQLLHREGRAQEALDCLEKALEAGTRDGRLKELAAEIHREAGRVDAAGQLLWENFTDRPGDLTYRALKVGTRDDFARWREQAITVLQAPEHDVRGRDWTALVSALLGEGDVDRAWEAALEGGCRGDLWLRLARERAREHPAEALPVLLQEANRAIEAKQRRAYREAAVLLVEARKLAERSDGVEAFHARVQALREQHRNRPALQDELTRARLP